MQFEEKGRAAVKAGAGISPAECLRRLRLYSYRKWKIREKGQEPSPFLCFCSGALRQPPGIRRYSPVRTGPRMNTPMGRKVWMESCGQILMAVEQPNEIQKE
jgi:hypothetical protein